MTIDAPHPRQVAMASALGFVILYGLAVVWEPGQWFDDYLFGVTQSLGVGPLAAWFPPIARTWLPLALFVVVVVVGVLRSFDRHRLRPVVTTASVVVLSTLISPVLRDIVLWRPVHDVGHGYLANNTFPSTHVTLVTALAVAIWMLLALRPAWRSALVVVLVVLVLVAMIGNVVGHAHRPSDTLGAVLLVGVVQGLVRGAPRDLGDTDDR